MKPVNSLHFCNTRGDDSAGHWQGWIFNEEQQEPWNNGQAKERPYPQPALPAGSSIKPPVNCHSSQLSRDYTHPLSPVPFFSLQYFTLSLLFLFPFTTTYLFLWRTEGQRHRINKTTRVLVSSLYIISGIHQMFVWDTQKQKSPMCLWELIHPSVSGVPPLHELYSLLKKQMYKLGLHCKNTTNRDEKSILWP